MRSISKIVVATAVAGACGYAAAATLTANPTEFALESAIAATGTSDVFGPSVKIDYQTQVGNIAQGQRLTLSSSRSFGSATSHTQTFTCSAAAGASVVFVIAQGTSNTNATQIVYDVSTASTTAGGTMSCTIPSIAFLASSVASAGTITVSGVHKATVEGTTIDTFSATAVASVASAFSFATVSTLDAVIDVASNRLTFASGGENVALNGGGFSDSFAVSVAKANRVTIGGAYPGSFALTITANPSFAFLQDPTGSTGAGTCSANSGSGQATAGMTNGASGTIALSPTSGTCTVLTATYATTANERYTISLGRSAVNVSSASATVFAPTTYSASYSLTNGTLTYASGTLSAGSWTQNGSTINLQYVPLSSTSSLQVIITNTSSTAGTLSFTAYNGAGESCTGDLGAVRQTGTTSVGGLLRSALLGTAAAGTTTNCSTAFANTGFVGVTLVSSTPSANTRVHSGFSVSDTTSRGIIVNSTN
jgi:hypothetical protein